MTDNQEYHTSLERIIARNILKLMHLVQQKKKVEVRVFVDRNCECKLLVFRPNWEELEELDYNQ